MDCFNRDKLGDNRYTNLDPVSYSMADNSSTRPRRLRNSRFAVDISMEGLPEESTCFSGKPKMLRFGVESDSEEDSPVSLMDHVGTGGTSPFSIKQHSPFDPSRTPNSHHRRTSACLWDSGLGSPTPKSIREALGGTVSPVPPPAGAGCNILRHAGGEALSPISLFQYDSDDTKSGGVPWNDMAAMPPDTPPHRRMKTLRIQDSTAPPPTPQSLLRFQRRSIRAATVARNRLAAGQAISSATLQSASCTADSSHCSELSDGSTSPGGRHDISLLKYGKLLDPAGPQTNVNPFTYLAAGGRTGVKRARHEAWLSGDADSSMDDSEMSEIPCKRLALREINTSRYLEEFHQVAKIGDGEFGSVHECINRLDGCHYAVKRSKAPVAESAFERTALNEVYAHAVLGSHVHVVRYFSAWAENGHMFIQNEFCNGGSLAGAIDEHHQRGTRFSEEELIDILLQTARGLKYIHSNSLVHLDIKPANIFIHRDSTIPPAGEGAPPRPTDLEDADFFETDRAPSASNVTYKIGDLGHVTSVTAPLVEEGDCRYLPVEILQERYESLPRADIFSLALTVYEAASLTELPKNGDDWHDIREVGLPALTHLSTELNDLLRSMANFDPGRRPSSAALVHHPLLVPAHLRTRAELCRELRVEQLRNKVLTKELVEMREAVHHQFFNPAPSSGSANFPARPLVVAPSLGRASRLLGRKCARSASLTAF